MATAGKRFADGVRELQDLVGKGTLTGKIEMNQAYAQRQHETLSYKHDDGTAHFLELALQQGYPATMQSIANMVLEGGIVAGMIEGMEKLADDVEPFTPKLSGDLADSASVHVLDGGSEIYVRRAGEDRLTAEEIRDKHRRGV